MLKFNSSVVYFATTVQIASDSLIKGIVYFLLVAFAALLAKSLYDGIQFTPSKS